LVKVKGVVVGAHLYLLLIVLITNASKFVVIGLTTEKENFIELSNLTIQQQGLVTEMWGS
jgi:hypothetical protein